MMSAEVMPTVGHVPDMDLEKYKQSVLERFSNPEVKDQALRICMDGSGKMPKFVFPSLLDQLALGGPIEMLSLCTASWMRFLSGVDEQGELIPLNDPMADKLSTAAKTKRVETLLEISEIFGDLKNDKRFVSLVHELLASFYEKGARETLRETVRRYS